MRKLKHSTTKIKKTLSTKAGYAWEISEALKNMMKTNAFK